MLNLSLSSVFLGACLLPLHFSIIHGFDFVKTADKITGKFLKTRNDVERKSVPMVFLRKPISHLRKRERCLHRMKYP
jgi:hypothetical protein